MSSKLRDFALIAEIIGAVAIVGSLIFVGLEIRQNSRISEVNAYQNLVSQIALMNTLRVENEEFAELFWRLDHGEETRDDTERARLEAFLYMVFRHGDLAYRQYENGLIQREALISALAPTRSFLNTATGQQVWAILAKSLHPDHVALIGELGLMCGSYTGTGSYC